MTKQQEGRREARRQPREVAATVRPIAESVARERGLVLWDVSFARHAGREVLTVAADRVGGVGSDELAGMAEELSREIDHADAVPGEARYTLEVTSPGAERELRTPEQFEVCVGREVEVCTADSRVVEGRIEGITVHGVSVGTEEGSVRVAFSDMSRARLTVKGFGR